MSVLKKHIFIIAALALAVFPAVAFAAVNIPSTADPSRVQEQIIAPPLPQTSPEVKTSAPSISPQQAPTGADKIAFVLTSIQIEGMTVYKEADVAPLYQKMIGQKVSLLEVYNLANELTTKYRNDGYILTQVIVPPQHIKDGHITLRAVEGYIDEVRVQNKTTSNTPSYYTPYGELIKESKPLNEKVLEKYMLLLNDLPGISAKSVLSPSPYTPGASDLTIIVEHKAYDVSAETDNRGSLFIGPQQYNTSARLNNALGYNEGITLQGAKAGDNMNSATLGISEPIGYLGTTLNFNATVTTTHPGYTLEQFDIRGLTHDDFISVTQPFIRSRSENFSATFKFEYFNTDRSDDLGDPLIEDRLRIERLSLLYQNNDRLDGADSFTTEMSKGIDALNASQPGDANLTRAEGDPFFFKTTFEATRTQSLPDTCELYTAVTGQKSADSLLTSEEFGVGGASYGSAYDSSEITGEDGLAGRVELRANPVYDHIQKLQPYTFYDIGKIWDPQNTDPEDRIMAIASAGVGMRTIVNNYISGSFEYAAPLTRPVAADNSKRPRLFGMLTAKF